MIRNGRIPFTVTCWALGSLNVLQAQAAPPSILEIDVQNRVQYFEDTSDPAKFAIDPNLANASLPKNFTHSVIISDIVSVNGQPAMGTLVEQIRMLGLTATPNAGQAIADVVRNNIQILTFEILKSDGTQLGTIVGSGFGGGAAPLGVPLQVTQGNNAIVGGVGAFLGVRGHVGQSVTAQTVATRQASIAEDPANRRRNGGGRARFVVTLFPMIVPQVVSTSEGPVIFHADFSPVTAARPARPGEVLIMKARGLGPTVPGVTPGQPFPPDKLLQVNSPLAVSVNDQPADVLTSVGWPTLIDSYRVDFRVPDGIAPGTAAVQLTAAWISGAPVSISVR